MGKRGERRPVGISWLFTWPLLPVFALMVFLSSEEMHRPRPEATRVIGGAGWEDRLHERIQAVTKALGNSGLDLSEPVETTVGSGSVRYLHRGYEVIFRPEDEAETELAIEALREVDPGLTLTRVPTEPDGFQVKIGIDGLLTHTVRFLASQPASAPPRVALVARGLGDDLRLARELVRTDAPVAFAVRPGRPFSKEVAELARLFDREVLADLSLVAVLPGGEEDAGVLPVDARVRSRLDLALESVPNAVGVVTDVEETLAAEPARLTGFLAELKRRGLFWVSDVPNSRRFGVLESGAGLRVAMNTAVVEGGTRPAMLARLQKLRGQARADGLTVALAQPNADLLEVLAGAIGRWRAAGIELVPASSLPRVLRAQVAG